MSNALVLLDSVTQPIIDLLNLNPIQTLNIKGILENTSPENLQVWVDHPKTPSGVLVRKGYFCYIATDSKQFLDSLLEDYFEADFYGFSGLSNFIANYLEPHFTLQWDSRCDLYYLPSGALQSSLKKNLISSIPIDYAEEIDSFYTYKDNESIYRIQESLSNLPSSGYFNGAELASWVLVHDDNSLGIMYTKEAWRGKGLAIDVTIDLCEKEIARGKSPFLQINQANSMSPGLALKCGFIPFTDATGCSKGNAIWFGGYRQLPDVFLKVARALNAPVNRLLTLYHLKIDAITSPRDILFPPELKDVFEFALKGSEILTLADKDLKNTSNVLEQFNILHHGETIGTLSLITHDYYWCYLTKVHIDSPSFAVAQVSSSQLGDIVLSLGSWLKSQNRDSLLFCGSDLDKYTQLNHL